MKVRVFFPVGNQYYLPSPWVEINGERSFEPVENQPQYKLAAVVEQAVQKGTAIIDKSMSMGDCYKVKAITPRASNKENSDKVEYSQIEVIIETATDAEAKVCLGMSDLGLEIFDGAQVVKGSPVIGGTFKDNTLNVIGRLANHGLLQITGARFLASNDNVYSYSPRFKTYSHVGEVINDKRLHYPKSSSNDENTEIRTMDSNYLTEKGLSLVLDGMNFIEFTVPVGEELTITLYTAFTPIR
ncbi:hypothetical protein [Aureispira anguillae]|uniref:Uncharacterized protein n=1 Tax=Aureispira anguillae TaxID=2864201 RepID=A0A915YD31_9BACT|nr:hypothetical protein [Aureispira anguillae]BDS10865.1 hypothetical protein AsAng_0015750 [Aureispira anguillae]BDS12343.1 hypothetical protein AsAng_0030640 [Aureispira anguillae]